MNNETAQANKSPKQALLIPTLLLCVFLSGTVAYFVIVAFVDLSTSFKVPIGTVSVLPIIAWALGIIMGVIMSALVIRFDHKSLLLSGIALYAIGALGFFFAQNFATVVLVHFPIGVGTAAIPIMVYTLIGEQLPLEKRGWAIGLTGSAGGATGVIVAILTGVIISMAGWRSVLLWFIIPFSVVCLLLGIVVIPSKQPQPKRTDSSLYAQALKKIFLNKSATACVVCAALFAFGGGAVGLFAVSFYRVDFSVSPAVGGAFASLMGVGIMAGGAIGGRLVNKFGRKPVALFNAVGGIGTALFAFMPILGGSVTLLVIAVTAGAIGGAGFVSLNLEQVPEFKGSMMSIYYMFTSVGAIITITIGGLVLNLLSNNFRLVMVIGGTVSLMAMPLLLFVAKDPCKIMSTH